MTNLKPCSHVLVQHSGRSDYTETFLNFYVREAKEGVGGLQNVSPLKPFHPRRPLDAPVL
jgi:hypothetical protein